MVRRMAAVVLALTLNPTPARAQDAALTITVVSADGHADVELSLEPNANPVGRTFQEGLFKQGIPATAFEVDDVEREHQRLKALGVVFTQEPTRQGPITLAVCADTCGNLIQLYQRASTAKP